MVTLEALVFAGAKDTRLGRDVALKALPQSVTHDPERLARFRREAQVLAALNHPHIAGIYGLEEADAHMVLESLRSSLQASIATSTVSLAVVTSCRATSSGRETSRRWPLARAKWSLRQSARGTEWA